MHWGRGRSRAVSTEEAISPCTGLFCLGFQEWQESLELTQVVGFHLSPPGSGT